MNSATARTLREYASKALPAVVKRQYPGMEADLYRLFKRWWNGRFNDKERAGFRRLAMAGNPLPEDLKKEARSCGVIVEWPPRPAEPAKRKRGKRANRRR